MKHAQIGLGASGTVHVGLIAAAVALTTASEPPHFHQQRGAIEIQVSFASAEPASDTSFIAALPADRDLQPTIVPSMLSPTAIELTPVKTAAVSTFVRAELPKLPAELDACDCKLPEHHLQTPKSRSIDAPRPPDAAEKVPQPIRRVQPVAHFATTEAVSLPASADPIGEEVDEPPKKIASNRPPPYPADAYQRRQQGRLVLEAHITAEGAVESLRVLESSGVASLDQAALDTVRGWRFEPAHRRGRPVSAMVNVPVRFAIRS